MYERSRDKGFWRGLTFMVDGSNRDRGPNSFGLAATTQNFREIFCSGAFGCAIPISSSSIKRLEASGRNAIYRCIL